VKRSSTPYSRGAILATRRSSFGAPKVCSHPGPSFAVRTRERRKFRFNTELGPGLGQRRRGEETDLTVRIMRSGATGYWVPQPAWPAPLPPLKPPGEPSMVVAGMRGTKRRRATVSTVNLLSTTVNHLNAGVFASKAAYLRRRSGQARLSRFRCSVLDRSPTSQNKSPLGAAHCVTSTTAVPGMHIFSRSGYSEAIHPPGAANIGA